MTPVGGVAPYQTTREDFVLKAGSLGAGHRGKIKDLSERDKGQIVVARQLGQSICKSGAVFRCLRSAMVRFIKSGQRKEQGRTSGRVMEGQGSLMHVRSQSFSRKAEHNFDEGYINLIAFEIRLSY